MKKHRTIFFLCIVLVLAGAWTIAEVHSIILPGTQPNVVQTLDDPAECRLCHVTQASGAHPVSIVSDWQGSMMGNSARDPIFYAAVAVANKDQSGVGEFCIRCHSPGGWLEGRSTLSGGEALTGNDLNGVQCDVCHRMKDPMLPDSTVNPPIPGYGNGMFVVQATKLPKRGPFSDAYEAHRLEADSFQRSGNLCGVCHNVSNPLYAANPITQPPYEYSPIERTHSEWLLSWYAQQGEAGNCQSCHMKPEIGYGCNIAEAPLRQNIPKHNLTGGNAFVPDILADFWGKAVDTLRLAAGKQRAIQMLQSAATVEATAYRLRDTVRVHVRVINRTGHKLPTGYPEGRRMWLNIVGRNASGDTVFQSGAYDFQTAELTIDAQAKIYHTEPGLTPARAQQLGLPPGPSFHFILNDTIYYDNRIPPRGFNNAAFAQHLAQPVGYSYADGQFSDSTTYQLPPSVAAVSVTLYYQTASKPYITFLRDENIGNPYDWRAWGDSLYAAWARHGKSRPVAMNTVNLLVTSVEQTNGIVQGFMLEQNYPNPFNPSTKISFKLQVSGFTSLKVCDLLGREVKTLVNEKLEPGRYERTFDASGLASGVYFYKLSVSPAATRDLVPLARDGETKDFASTKKLLLLR